LWHKDANYRHRPIIIGNRVIAEPWAFDLTSGVQEIREHPLTGLEVPWSIMRPGHHCGMLTGCDNMLLFRSGYTGFYDLDTDSGTRHFAGHRLGCWINAIPANGLVVIPEASAGCVCMFSIASTIVLEPREPRRPWTLYSSVGPTTPVQRMSLNLGAPGDRRDEHGKLWLSYPRSIPNPGLETSLDIKLDLAPRFSAGGGFFSNDGDQSTFAASGQEWLVSSGARGISQLSIPLLGKDDAPTNYTVRLIFAAPSNGQRGQGVLDIELQGRREFASVDVAGDGDQNKPVILEAKSVAVSSNLVVDLIPHAAHPGGDWMPVLSAIEVEVERPTEPVESKD
jgi:hypothetical protein